MTQEATVLGILRTEGMHTPASLETQTRIPRQSIHTILSKLRRAGKIEGSTAQGYRIAANASVTVEPSQQQDRDVQSLPFTAGSRRELSTVAFVLLNDKYAPMPRASLEDSSKICGAALTACLQEFLGREAIKLTPGGFVVVKRAVLESYLTKVPNVAVASRDVEEEEDEDEDVDEDKEIVVRTPPAMPRAPARQIVDIINPPTPTRQCKPALGSVLVSDSGGLTLTDTNGEIILVLLASEVGRVFTFLKKCESMGVVSHV